MSVFESVLVILAWAITRPFSWVYDKCRRAPLDKCNAEEGKP